MANDTYLTMIGTLTADPELRFTPSGAAVSNFTVASNPRFFKDGEWKDGDPIFMRCNIWRDAAEHVAESFTRGMRVIVSGRMKQRSYETKEGEKRTVMELEVDECGPSLKWATAKVNKVTKGDGAPAASYGEPVDDPWGNAPTATKKAPPKRQPAAALEDPWGSADASGTYDDSEPPF